MNLAMLIARRSLRHCGKNVKIEKGVVFKNPERISIGDNVHLRHGCKIYAQDATASENLEDNPYIIIGDGSRIKENAVLNTYGGYIKLGKNANIGQNSVIYGHGGVEMGDNSGIAPLSIIVAADYDVKDTSTPFCLQGEIKKGVKISNNVICSGATVICDGVEIGENVIIGAGSVIRKRIPRNAVVLGNPAQIAYIRKGKEGDV